MMRLLNFTLITIAFLASLSCSSPRSEAHIAVSIPTIEQEATSIWRTINDIAFLEAQGYTIHLPDNKTIDSLISKSKNKAFGDADFQTIYAVLESGIYNKTAYNAAFNKVKDQENMINGLVARLKSYSSGWDWTFKTFESYQVVFTLYGTGGSYDPDQGLVTLFTNEEGRFMNYQNPVNTILHEIVHMGIETSIVQRYSLPHGLKERIVDTMTFLLFGDKLPDYAIQPMGDTKIDTYIRELDDLKKMNTLVEQYQREN
ncbi:MAG: hypothetical protein AB8F95_20890 [Bacteroidia bacterium]